MIGSPIKRSTTKDVSTYQGVNGGTSPAKIDQHVRGSQEALNISVQQSVGVNEFDVQISSPVKKKPTSVSKLGSQKTQPKTKQITKEKKQERSRQLQEIIDAEYKKADDKKKGLT